MLPGNQEVFVFEKQGLCDDVFMASQSVQTTLIDDVPHNHICVLRWEGKGNTCLTHAITNSYQTTTVIRVHTVIRFYQVYIQERIFLPFWKEKSPVLLFLYSLLVLKGCFLSNTPSPCTILKVCKSWTSQTKTKTNTI